MSGLTTARPRIEGRARRLGDDVNTDYLIASHRKKNSLDPQVLRHFLLEDLIPGFAATVSPGDVLVAGRNFGCGSAMEVAVTVVVGAGISMVIAPTFARTYWRNAANNGLLLVSADTSTIREGERLLDLERAPTELQVLDPQDGSIRVIACEPPPPFVLQLRTVGGLIPWLRQHRSLRAAPLNSTEALPPTEGLRHAPER